MDVSRETRSYPFLCEEKIEKLGFFSFNILHHKKNIKNNKKNFDYFIGYLGVECLFFILLY